MFARIHGKGGEGGRMFILSGLTRVESNLDLFIVFEFFQGTDEVIFVTIDFGC